MICPVCGKEIADGSAVCPICGVALAAPQNPVPNAAPQYAPQQNPVPDAAPQYAPQQNSAPNAAPQYAPQQYAAQPYAAPQYAAPQNPAVMPKNAKQFIKQMSHIQEYKNIRTEINVCGILFYVFAAATIALSLLVKSSGAGLVDAFILVGFGLWIQLGYSRVGSIIALVYSILNMIYMTLSTGKLGGYLILIAAVCSVIYTFKAAKAFKQYKESAAVLPPQQQFPQQ